MTSDGGSPPSGVDSFDALAEALGDLRRESGSPSYAAIAARVGEVRAARGSRGVPGKVTVYDCFRAGRRRVDAALVRDIVVALGHSEAVADEWRRLAGALGGSRAGDHVVTEVISGNGGPAGERRADRNDLLHDETMLRSLTARVTVFTGMPGVGKSTCALAVAERLRPDHLTIRVHARGYDPALPASDPLDVLRSVVHRLDPRVDHRASGAVLRRRLAELGDRHDIVVIVEDLPSAAHVSPLLVRARRLRYVLTSRSSLDALDGLAAVERLTLERRPMRPLPQHAVAEHIRAVLGHDAGAADIERLASLSGGIVLDLEIMLRFALDNPAWTVGDVIERFASQPPDDRMRPVLATSVAALAEAPAALFRRLGLVAGPVSARLLTDGDPGARGALDALRSAHLVDAASDGVVTMHDTVRAFARRSALETDPFSVRTHFATGIVARARALVAGHDPGTLADPHLVGDVWAAAVLASDHGLDADVVGLAMASSEDLGVSGFWSETLDLLERAEAVVGPGDRAEIALLRARACEKLGRFDEALALLHRVRRLGDEPVPGRTSNIIGNIHRWRGEYPAALDAYARALATARAAGSDITAGRALGNSADVRRVLGDYPAAEQLYAEALGVSGRIGDAVNLSIVRSNRALLLASTNRAEEAVAEFDALLAEQSAGTDIAHVLVVRAIPLLTLGRVGDARRSVARAREIAGRSGSFDVVPEALNMEAELLRRGGGLEEAERAATEARRAGEELGSPLILIESDRILAAIALDRGDVGSARRQASVALAEADRVGDRVEAARASLILGVVERRAGDDERADRWFSAAVVAFERMGHTLLEEAEATRDRG
jgi:tetratricopeptide (TPR) repeat protein